MGKRMRDTHVWFCSKVLTKTSLTKDINLKTFAEFPGNGVASPQPVPQLTIPWRTAFPFTEKYKIYIRII